MRVRLVPILALAVAAAIALPAAGCGGGDSGSDVAGVAPAGAPLFVELTVQPDGELSENVQALAKNVAGIDDLGGLIVEEIEQSALDSGETLDFEKEIAPWLGDKAGISFRGYDGDDFNGYAIAIETTDAGAAEEFVDKQATSEAGPASDASFEGVDYKIEADDGQAVGVVDDMLVLAEDEATFNATIEASSGESLADEDAFTSAMDAAASEGLANLFVDIGLVIESSGGTVDPDTQWLFETAGIELKEATAVASIVPGADQIEIDFSTNAAGENPPSGDVSELLGSMPGGALAAAAAPAVGERLGEAIDSVDESGVPGEIPPNQLKKTLKAAGVDLDQISASIGDVAAFAEGNTERNLTGALVIEASGEQEATNTVANVGLFLRRAEVAGVTALSGNASGFSIRSEGLGRQPLVVAAEGKRIAVSYGLAASALALRSGQGATLSANPQYKEAVAALGDTPISAFVNGPAALALVTNLLSADELSGLEEARPALDKVAYLAAGNASSGDLATAKLIVGFTK
jgi:uncharacterized protein DUF3352